MFSYWIEGGIVVRSVSLSVFVLNFDPVPRRTASQNLLNMLWRDNCRRDETFQSVTTQKLN